MLEYIDLCMGCMADKSNYKVCPHCGWVEGTIPTEQYHLPPRTILNNRYLLGRVLGYGGFGITYLAWDLRLGVKLAIKEFLPIELASRINNEYTVSFYNYEKKNQFKYGLKKFLDEAKTLVKFNEHVCIVNVYDYFEENNTAYLVMRYLDGTTLSKYLRSEGGKIPYDTAINIMMPVLDALREVHSHGILHRDISPENIYITVDKQVKLLDFGAARHAIGEKSKSLSVMLKPGYAPPEQYYSKGKYGPWTDIYASAATIYKMITGNTPGDAMKRMIDDNISEPSNLGIKMPKNQEIALMKALSLKVENRYQSINEFQNAISITTVKDTDKEDVKKLVYVVLQNNSISFNENKKNKKDDNQNTENEKADVHNIKLEEQSEILEIKKSKQSKYPNIKNYLKFKKLYIMIFIIISIIIVFTIKNINKNNKGIFNKEENIKSVHNSIEGRIISKLDNWIYYHNYLDNGLLYKIKQNGTSNTKLKYNGKIIGNYLYFENEVDNYSLYKMKLDGSNKIKLNDDISWYTIISENWIYYCNKSDKGNIYKIKTDGKGKLKINNYESELISVKGDYIYYINVSDNRSIYKIKKDGTKDMKINDNDSYFISIIENYIYYNNVSENSIYRIKTDGSEMFKITDDAFNFMVVGDWIYFESYSKTLNKSNIYKIKTDATERIQVTDENTTYIQMFDVVDDWIYYKLNNLNNNSNEYENIIYKIKIDGTGKTKIRN